MKAWVVYEKAKKEGMILENFYIERNFGKEISFNETHGKTA